MKKMIEISIKNRKITLFILVMLLFAGVYVYGSLPKQENPEINAPLAMITAIYPGASPENVEELVTDKIYEELKSLEGYDYVNSYSVNSASISVVRLKYGTDTNEVWNDLRMAMDDVKKQLPGEVTDITINTDLIETAGILISISGKDQSCEELSRYAEDLQEELDDVSGISRFEIVGEQEKKLYIEFDHKKLNYYDISLNDLVGGIKLQNIEIPSGEIDSEHGKIGIKISGKFTSISDVENIIVAGSTENSSITYLKDVASVYFDYNENMISVAQDGETAVILAGYFEKEKNIINIGKKVEDRIEKFQKQLPEGIDLYPSHYQPDLVEKSVNGFMKNLIQGMILVIIVVLIGMGIRNSIIVSVAIPSAILLTVLAMKVFSIDVHQISIAALIVALGMLVDNAIVVSDSIQLKMDDGMDRLTACVDGTSEVAIPVFTSTLTTLAAYLPLLVLPSIAGEYISALPKIVMISLVMSFGVAILITPSLAFIFFKKSVPKESRAGIRKIFDFMLIEGLKRKYIVVISIIGVLIFTTYIALGLGLEFFPFADTDILYVEIKSDVKADKSVTIELIDEVEELLSEEDYVLRLTTAIGGSLPKFYNTVMVSAPSPDKGQIMVKTDIKKIKETHGDMTKYIEHLQEKFDENIVSGTVTAKQLLMGEPIEAPITIIVSGEEYDDILRVSRELKNELIDFAGTQNVRDDFDVVKYQYSIEPINTKTHYYGLTKFDIQNEISIALKGRNAGVYRLNGKEYEIMLKSDIKSINQLKNFKVKSSLIQSKVYVKEVADINLSPEYVSIKKYKGKRSVQVMSDVLSGYEPIDIQKELNKKIENMDLSGVELIYQGEAEKIAENFGNVSESAVIAIFIVFVVLLIQFKSFMQPIVILVTVPLSAIGSFLGLKLFGQNLSFVAFMGIVSLIGIVVNNAIVLLDYINLKRKEENTIEESCIKAVDKRFRPIMLSTITTVIGLMPIVASKSIMFTPMAIALMSGLIVSTILTLVVIPVVYSLAIRNEKNIG